MDDYPDVMIRLAGNPQTSWETGETRDRIMGAIAMGTWKELRKELVGEEERQQDYTIREFADVYFEEYCKIRNTCLDSKEERLKTIEDIVGHHRVGRFSRPATFSSHAVDHPWRR
jgi:hypothetical protein